MLACGIDCTIFFYNPNIHPLKERFTFTTAPPWSTLSYLP